MNTIVAFVSRCMLLVVFVLGGAASVVAQSDGISYQAVIINPKAQELPGVDKAENILPNAAIAIRFTIYNSTNGVDFSEVQFTTTDRYGMIHLLIGATNHDAFTSIHWEGNPKDLKVEIDFSGLGSDFLDLSRQPLHFVPYAYHRNITATGTLSVDKNTVLNAELLVEGPTTINSSLLVARANQTNLTGTLNVDGNTALNGTLNVQQRTTLYDSLNVLQSPAFLDGKVVISDSSTHNGVAVFNAASVFNGAATFNAPVDLVQITVNGPSYLNGPVEIAATTLMLDSLEVNAPTVVNGQTTFMADMDTVGGDDNFDAYPVRIVGGSQGLAVKVEGKRSTANNYISFWDEEKMWGRIEGQTYKELLQDPEFIFENSMLLLDEASAILDVAIAALETTQQVVQLTAAGASATACVGLGACVTAPIPSLIVAETTGLVLKIANAVSLALPLVNATASLAEFNAQAALNIGVSYQSGAGDYAEWLPKLNPEEKFQPGDIVGVRNGYVTRSTSGAEKVMVVSTYPIVLGNMPQPNEEANYEKIAFMGQVPVKVLGNVQAGDYVLPHLLVEGYGRAVHPEEMKLTDYKKIVGVVWSVSDMGAYKFVNLAVGLNTNDLVGKLQKQEEELTALRAEMNRTNEVLSMLLPGFEQAMQNEYSSARDSSATYQRATKRSKTTATSSVPDNNHAGLLTPHSDNIVYITPTNEQVLLGIEQAKEVFRESGEELQKHPFWQKMENEPAYKAEIMELIKSKLEKGMHMHQEVNKTLSKQVKH